VRPLRLLAWLAIPLLLIGYGLLGRALSPGNDAIVLRLAHVLNQQHPVHAGMLEFANEVERLSAGQIDVELYADGSLGSERELIELVQIGSVAATKVSAGQLESFAPSFRVFSLPYLFADEAHFWRFAESPAGVALLAAARPARLEGLTYFDAGSRSFYLGKGLDRPIRHPDDLRGLALRVMPSPSAMAMVETLGAKPVPIPFGELYSALDTGTVDGAENNPPSLHTSRQYEVASSYSLNRHATLPDVLVIGTRTWERLNDEQRGWLRAAAQRAMQVQRVHRRNGLRAAGFSYARD
jgi:tripartite ATP-independent transporter DctP family solute receptor